MSLTSPAFDGNQDSIAESADQAFRRIAAEKLRYRNCPEPEVAPSIERLLRTSMGLELKG